MKTAEFLQRIEKLESEIAQLRQDLSIARAAEARVEYVAAPPFERQIDEQGILEKMRQNGLLSAPLPAEAEMSEAWAALTAAEKRAHVELMHGLKLDPSLSEIVAQNRR